MLKIQISTFFGTRKTSTWKIVTRMNPTGQFPPGKHSPSKIPTQDFSYPANSQLDYSNTENFI